ncbi:methyltransferase domain-containing protein [Vibrio breoganii]
MNFLFPVEQQYTSRKTSINSKRLPAVFNKALDRKLILPNKIIFDIGCGKYDHTKTFSETTLHCSYLQYDPYNQPDEVNAVTFNRLRNEKADYIILSNVLNVIKEPEIQEALITLANRYLKPDGLVLCKIHEGNKSGEGKASQEDCWQENRATASYIKQFESHFDLVQKKYDLIIASCPKPC